MKKGNTFKILVDNVPLKDKKRNKNPNPCLQHEHTLNKKTLSTK